MKQRSRALRPKALLMATESHCQMGCFRVCDVHRPQEGQGANPPPLAETPNVGSGSIHLHQTAFHVDLFLCAIHGQGRKKETNKERTKGRKGEREGERLRLRMRDASCTLFWLGVSPKRMLATWTFEAGDGVSHFQPMEPSRSNRAHTRRSPSCMRIF